MRCYKQHQTWVSHLGLATVLLLNPSIAGANVRSHASQRSIMIDGERIRLGDVHPTAPRDLLGVDIAPSPPAGRQSVVSRGAVRAALRRAGADVALADGLPARQVVKRQAARLSADALSDRVRASLAEKLPLGVKSERILGLDGVNIPTGPVDVEVRLGRLARSTPITVSIAVRNRVVERQSATVILSGQPRTPTLRANLPRGTVVTSDHLGFKTTSFAALPHDSATRNSDLVGKRLTQPGRTGRPIQRAAAEVVPLIERGATIQLVANARGLRISRMAIAQEDGRLGQFIRVKATNGNTIVRARVRSSGEVGLDLSGAR